MAAHRLFRLFIISGNSTSSCRIAELELRTVADVPEIPSGGSPIGSSQYSTGNSYSRAFDGDVSTYWRNSSSQDIPGQWIGYDYGAGNEKEIVQYAITAWTTPTYAPKQFQLECSDDGGVTWDLFSVQPADQTGWTAGEQRVFNVEPPQPQPIRATQLPIIVVEKSNQPTRISQFPILLVALPAQPAQVTQMPILVAEHDVETPLPTPFLALPHEQLVEEIEWLTSVSISDNGREQRQALRANPRRRFKCSAVFVTEEERRQFIDLLMQTQALYVDWPVWAYSAPLAPAASGTTELKFTPRSTDLRDGEYAAIYDAHTETTHVVKVDTMAGDGCTLAAPLDFDVTAACSICPLLKMRVVDRGKLDTDGVSGLLDMNLEVVANRDLMRTSDTSMLTLYAGQIILDKPQLAGLSDMYDAGVVWVDNDVAIPKVSQHHLHVFKGGSRTFKLGRYNGDMDWLRAFLAAVKGRQGTFRLPTWFDDLPLAVQPALGATVLVSSNVQAEKYLYNPANKFIRIESRAGVIYRTIGDFRRIFTEEGVPIGVQITLNESIGNNAGANDIRKISFCPLTRLDNDVVSITHGDLDAIVSMSVKTVIA